MAGMRVGQAVGMSTGSRPPIDTTVTDGLAAVAAAVVTLSGCGLHGSPSAASGAAVQPPSCATPFPGKPTPSVCPATPSPTVLAQRECTSADLSVSALSPGAYHGYATQSVYLVNGSGRPCFLSGVPSITAHVGNGGDKPVSVGQFASQRLDLQPGAKVMIAAGAPGACSGMGAATRQQATSLTVALAGGDLTASGSGLNWDVECGSLTVLLFGPAT